jgi:hypothetical protein
MGEVMGMVLCMLLIMGLPADMVMTWVWSSLDIDGDSDRRELDRNSVIALVELDQIGKLDVRWMDGYPTMRRKYDAVDPVDVLES